MAENLDILESFGEKINNKVIYNETHKTVGWKDDIKANLCVLEVGIK